MEEMALSDQFNVQDFRAWRTEVSKHSKIALDAKRKFDEIRESLDKFE